ncbi:MAG TPA: hypothetical protein VKA46_16720 [Gemmataceae bacterium]|nr:hypothetical protein [Gemmataceae bacterium]
MNPAQVLTQGILKPDGTLVLEEPPSLPAGPVEVLIRALPEAAPAAETWWEYLQRSRAEMLAQGHTFRTREEIDADRARVQASDEERRQARQRLQSSPE